MIDKNIKIILTDNFSKRHIINNILTLKFDSSKFIPSDYLSFSVIIDDFSVQFTNVELFIDDKLTFVGIVDEQQIDIQNKVTYMSIECRSASALMLDNEVKPYIYFRLSSEQLLEKHAKPFGVKGAYFPHPSTINFIQVKKGSSHWSIIELFCKQQYKQIPILKPDGFIYLDTFSNHKVTFSNHIPNSINYYSAKITDNRRKILSKIFIKTGLDSYGPTYGKYIDNVVAQNLNIKRERFYHPPKEWIKDYKASAMYYMKNAQIDSLSVELYIPSIMALEIGQSARFISDKYVNENLYISNITISIDDSGTVSKIKLLDKSFL